jgi:hypothetical protein
MAIEWTPGEPMSKEFAIEEINFLCCMLKRKAIDHEPITDGEYKSHSQCLMEIKKLLV